MQVGEDAGAGVHWLPDLRSQLGASARSRAGPGQAMQRADLALCGPAGSVMPVRFLQEADRLGQALAGSLRAGHGTGALVQCLRRNMTTSTMITMRTTVPMPMYMGYSLAVCWGIRDARPG